jgi:hypothetical protein
MAVRKMFRYKVPVDDGAHSFKMNGDPVAVAMMVDEFGHHYVELWAEHTEGVPEKERTFKVYGTGHQLPYNAWWIGTCPRSPEGLIWHLYELRVV